MPSSIALSFSDLNVLQAQSLMDCYAKLVDLKPAVMPVQSIPPVQPTPVQSIPPAQSMPSAAPAQSLVDKDDVPYNPEVHAPLDGSSKGLLQDGRWKCKRGIQRQLYDDWARQHAQSQQPQPFGFPDPRTANTVTNGEPTVPDEATVLKKAQDLAVVGLLTAAESARIMALAGTADHNELVRDPAKRAIAWAELVKLEQQQQQ
jgi:hypothetical protein